MPTRFPKWLISALKARFIGPLLVLQMCIMEVTIDLRRHSGDLVVPFTALGILAFGIWIALLMRHLIAIQSSPLWVLSFLIGQTLMAWASYSGLSALAWIMLGVVVFIQIPFAVLSPPVEPGPLDSPRSSGPSA